MDRNELEAVLRREWADTIEDKGGHCPICDRWGKINIIKIRGVMIKQLHWIYKEGGGDWLHIPSQKPKFGINAYAFTSFKHWGMVEQKEVIKLTKEERAQGMTQDKRTSGIWRVTPIGYDFLFNGLQVPKAVFTYNDVRVGQSDDSVTARECAFEKFNYDEMMGTTFNGDYDGLNYD